ncbi:molybdopterin-binding protein [Streptomyces sp. NPDC008150]|uniref:molybdopterin molybdotransferase MoeA n=1 Tax=Streptomyces sp. NPDC008150 TaxID=3364816 RepID=UPI0036DFBFF0
MTARSAWNETSEGLDLDVEDALALVNEGRARPAGALPGDDGTPSPAASPSRQPPSGDRAKGTRQAARSGRQDEGGAEALPDRGADSGDHGGNAPGNDTGGGSDVGAAGTAPHGTAPGRPSARPAGSPAGTRHRATPWDTARAISGRAVRPFAAGKAVSVPLDAALGLVLAAPLAALTDLPSFDTSAMDGWAVAGPGPWVVRDGGVLAGHDRPDALSDGEAVRIATGARIPQDTTAVLRSEHGRADDKGRLHATRDLGHGQDIRPRGQECRSGDQLLPSHSAVSPAVLGLAAAAGYDTLAVLPRPRVEVLVLGDELLATGLPRDGLIRDALGPMLPPWLRAMGADVVAVRRLGDDPEALHRAVTGSAADLVVTTGGTASGPVDHVHPTLRRIGAELLVDGVKVRPGHPMVLARVKEDQHLVGLPGNPLAAVAGLLTLVEPLLRTLSGRPAQEGFTLPLRGKVTGHQYDTRLVPVVLRGDEAVPLRFNGPAMLRGVAAAEALAVVPPGGAGAGRETELLDLPWATAGNGVCFT